MNIPIAAFNKAYLNAKRVITNGKPITIIRYHSISDMPDPYTISPKTFASQAEFISKHYNIGRLRQLRDIFSIDNDVDKRTVIFTFDDAYSDFFETAYPILDDLTVPCTLFIPSGFIGEYNEWDSHLDNYVKRPIMTASQLLELAKYGPVDFGSHTVNHQSMTTLTVTEMKSEAMESRNTLEDLLGRPITMFSYPFGHFSEITTRVLLEAHYDIAVTSRWGTLNTDKGILNLKRITLAERDTHDDIRAKIDGLYDIRYVRGAGYIRRLTSKFRSSMLEQELS